MQVSDYLRSLPFPDQVLTHILRAYASLPAPLLLLAARWLRHFACTCLPLHTRTHTHHLAQVAAVAFCSMAPVHRHTTSLPTLFFHACVSGSGCYAGYTPILCRWYSATLVADDLCDVVVNPSVLAVLGDRS